MRYVWCPARGFPIWAIGLNIVALVSGQTVNSLPRSISLRQISSSSSSLPSAVAAAPATTRGNRGQATETREESNLNHHAIGERTSSDEASPNARQLAANPTHQDTNALLYLQKYGYMQQTRSNAETNNLISEESFSEAVLSFQRFAGLPETGTIDNQTLKLMRAPRCGNIDKVGHLSTASRLLDFRDTHNQLRGHARNETANNSYIEKARRRRRRKRYALQGSKWRRQELTYRISQYPTKFSGKRHEVDAQIEKAFGIWSQVAPINFVVKKEGRVHIDIRFASGDHGDGDAFDGPGNTLAHAYFPQYGGDAHFDDQEYWTIDSYTGTNIFQVAAHELGHSLGLGHSNVREALMAPFYQKYKPNFKLHVDDILAIQALYGEKAFLPDDVPPLSSNDIGSSSSFDSSPSSHHHRRPFQPPATTSMPTTPTTTTTAATTTTTTTMMTPSTTTFASPSILGPRFMFGLPPIESASRFNPFRPSLPPISRNGFGHRDHQPAGDHEGSDNGIDNQAGSSSGDSTGGGAGSTQVPASFPADLCTDSTIDAVTRTEDGRSYVFKDDYYWQLTNEGLAKNYPRKISLDWEGLPGSLDAALTWADGKTFFFKGNKYWRFRNKRRDVGYPKLISAGFAGIPDDIDAAFVWSGNGRTYIFKGTEYWRFDSKADPPVSAEYPRSIRVWNGVPYHINAAFRWDNNVTYFFKGNQYYRFNDKDFKVETRGKPPFPRPSAEWWFGCVNTNLAQRALPSNHLKDGIVEEESAVYQDTDWSYLAGLEQNTKTMGTHISDQRPLFGLNDSDISTQANKEVLPPKTSTVAQIFGGRIGFLHPTSRVHSSAITTSPNYCIQVLCLALVILEYSTRIRQLGN